MNILNFKKNYITFNNIVINFILDEHNNIWFNGKNICEALKYKSRKDALRSHVSKKNKEHIKNFNVNIGKNIKKDSIYINESGLYSLLIHSRTQIAIEFQEWITENVLPSLRKYGIYEIEDKQKKKIKNMNLKIKQLEKQKIKLENNIKKEKYPDGGFIYIIEVEKMYKIGITENLKKRINTYNTGNPNKTNIIYYKKTTCPIQIELCIKSILYKYRIKNKKEFYNCKLQKIKDVINKCINIEKKYGNCNDNQVGGNNENKSYIIDKYIDLLKKIFIY